MKRLALVFLAFMSLTTFAADSGWESLSNKDGIEVWQKRESRSKINAFRGRKVIKAPADKVVGLIMDTQVERKKRWVDLVMEWKNLDSDPTNLKYYSSYDMPFPVSDRDFVFKVKKEIDPKDKKVTVRIWSVADAEHTPENSVGVMGWVERMWFQVRMISPTESEVVVESHVDPKGIVPGWAVNMINRGWPVNTLLGIEREVALKATPIDKETTERIMMPAARQPSVQQAH